MSRLGYLARHPKRTLGALSTLLVAAGLTVGSGAYFTDTDSSLSNSATAATFGITMLGSTDPAFDAFSCDADAVEANRDCNVSTIRSTTAASDGQAANSTTFEISRLVPKDGRYYFRSFGIRNDGNVPAKLRLKALGAGLSEDLLDALKVTVSAQAPLASTPPNDPLPTAITTAANHLDDIDEALEIPANTTWTYRIRFEFDDTGASQNALRGDAATITLKALAVDSNQDSPTSAQVTE